MQLACQLDRLQIFKHFLAVLTSNGLVCTSGWFWPCRLLGQRRHRHCRLLLPGIVFRRTSQTARSARPFIPSRYDSRNLIIVLCKAIPLPSPLMQPRTPTRIALRPPQERIAIPRRPVIRLQRCARRSARRRKPVQGRYGACSVFSSDIDDIDPGGCEWVGGVEGVYRSRRGGGAVA